MKTQKSSYGFMQALLTAAVMAVALPELAMAQDLASSVNEVHTGLQSIPSVVAGAFYIGGAALIGAGALKLKAHAENPGQHPIGHGLGRIVSGSALIALPAFATWLNSSLNIGTGNFSANTLGTISQ